MKALMYYGKGDVRMEDVPEPVTQPGTVKIKPAWNGLCGSDLHLYYDGPIPPVTPTNEDPHPLTGEKLPIVLGHEFSGEVIEVGEGVTTHQVGDHVAVEPIRSCGECGPCKAGRYNACPKMACFGISGGGGGLSEQVVVPANRAHLIGDIPLDQAALFDPLAVAYHGVRLSGAKSGDIAVVAGAGPVGLMAAASLRGIGATVIISEPQAIRRQAAIDANVADHVVDPINESLVDKVSELTGGEGADAVYDCAGVEAALNELLEVVKVGGVLEMLAIYPTPPAINLLPVVFKEIVIEGSVGYANDYQPVIELVQQGKIDLAPFITARIKADDFVTGGLEYLQSNMDTQIKMIVSL